MYLACSPICEGKASFQIRKRSVLKARSILTQAPDGQYEDDRNSESILVNKDCRSWP